MSLGNENSNKSSFLSLALFYVRLVSDQFIIMDAILTAWLVLDNNY